jgi:hypothetical protein
MYRFHNFFFAEIEKIEFLGFCKLEKIKHFFNDHRPLVLLILKIKTLSNNDDLLLN